MGSKASTCIGKGNPPTSIPEVENVGWKTINWGEINLKSFSEPVFFHGGSFIWSGRTWGTLCGRLQGVNTSFQPQRTLEERWKCKCPGTEGISQASILYEFELASVRDGMKEILLQCRSVTHPCPCGCASIPMASMTAGWECQGGNRCLLLSAKLSFLLAKRNSISVCCVLGVPGGTWSVRWIIMNIPHLLAQEAAERTLSLFGRALRDHQPKTVRQAGRHSDMRGQNNPLWRHSPQGAIVLGMFLKLCNMRKEMHELSQSSSSIVGMLNSCNEGNCSTPAMVGGSHQICWTWPDPSLSPTPRLKEQASFVFWWNIYTVKQIRA